MAPPDVELAESEPSDIDPGISLVVFKCRRCDWDSNWMRRPSCDLTPPRLSAMLERNPRLPPIFISGEPVAQPRHRFRVMGKGAKAIAVAYLPKKHAVHGWKSAVASTYQAQNAGVAPLDGPLEVSLAFVLPRPDSYTTKRGPNVRAWHDRRPDPDNLAKAALDALKGVAWGDDAQICRLSVAKVMASATEPMGLWITVSPVTVSPATGSAFTPRLVTPGLFA